MEGQLEANIGTREHTRLYSDALPTQKVRHIHLKTQPGLPIKKGRCGTRTHDDKRNGTTTLFTALELAEGRLTGSCMQRHRHQEWIKFLNQIDRETPAGLDLHLIVDNYATHKHPKVNAWLNRHPRFHIHFTLTSSSWLNLVERWFREITDKRIRRGVFKSVAELVKTVMDYVQQHNANPKTFVWTAKSPNAADYAQHGPGQFQNFLFVPGEQQAYTYGGGINQLDVYKGVSTFSEPELLVYAGIGVQKQFERSAQREGWKLEVVQSQKDTDAAAPFKVEYLLRETSDPTRYKWRAVLYSKTGTEGPFCQVDFFETGDKLHSRSLNSEFIDLGPVLFPGKMEVARDQAPLQVYSVRKALANTEVDPALFEPIKPAPGCVMLIHEPDSSGGQTVGRIDLPKMADLNAALMKMPDYAPEPAKQPIVIHDPHLHETREIARPENANPPNGETRPVLWKLLLGFAGVLFFGALSLQIVRRREKRNEE